MRFSARHVSALVVAVLVHGNASRSDARPPVDIELTPIDGGAKFRIGSDALEVVSDSAARRTDSGVRIETDAQPATGCQVVTPWLPVPAASEVFVFPGVELLGTQAPATAPLVTFRAQARDWETKRRRAQDFRLAVHDLDPELPSTGLESTKPLVYALRVEAASELRIEVCDVAAGTALQVNDVGVVSLPLRPPV